MREGCLEPITIWRGVILDGHKRYKFCSYEDIEYEVRELHFKTREEAVIWVCSQRLPELTVHMPMYRYLVGKWYTCKKQLNKGQCKHSDPQEQNPKYSKKKRNSIWDTSSRLTEKIGIARSTIENDGKFALVMDRIADVEPALFEAILRREVHFRYGEILEIGKMDEKEISEIKRKRLGKKDVKMRRRNKMETWDKHLGGEHMEEKIQLKTGIKEMPAFDPDMEIKGLTLTIPTWINAIARAERKTDMALATDKAKEQLAANLARLQEQISRTLEVLTCTKTEP